MPLLAGKTAIVTGAAQGIGAALAKAFAGEGANVVAADLADASDTQAAIQAAGGKALTVRADVTDNAALADMVASAEAAFGPVAILVNNAGLFTALKLQHFMDIEDAEWDRMLQVNVRAVAQSTRAAVPSMARNGGGSIINIGSGTVFRGAPLFMHYVASKGAVHAMSRVMARELADRKIRVNCIAPGFTASQGVREHPEMMERFGAFAVSGRMIQREMQPQDLAGAALWLASDLSAFVTGQIVNVDGGAFTY